MKIIERDITTIDDGIICHQVNCFGRMNSGVAKAIRAKFPVVFEEYSSVCSQKGPDELLGTLQPVYIPETNLIVMNCFSQKNYGYDGKLYTDYVSIDKIFRKIQLEYLFDFPKVYVPYLYGCGLGGGDWNIVSEIICRNIPEVIFCKFGGT